MYASCMHNHLHIPFPPFHPILRFSTIWLSFSPFSLDLVFNSCMHPVDYFFAERFNLSLCYAIRYSRFLSSIYNFRDWLCVRRHFVLAFLWERWSEDLNIQVIRSWSLLGIWSIQHDTDGVRCGKWVPDLGFMWKFCECILCLCGVTTPLLKSSSNSIHMLALDIMMQRFGIDPVSTACLNFGVLSPHCSAWHQIHPLSRMLTGGITYQTWEEIW